MESEIDYGALGLSPVVVGGTPDPVTPETVPETTGDEYYDNLTPAQKTVFDGFDPESKDFYSKNNLQVVITETETDLVPIGDRLGKNVTKEVEASQTPSDLTYQGIYGGVTDTNTGASVERPGYDFVLRGAAAIFDIINNGEPNPIQGARDDRQKQMDRFNELATEVYEGLPGVVQEGGGKVFEQVIRDEKGDVVLGDDGLPKTNAISLPDPTSRAWGRIASNVVNSVYEQVGGLAQEGGITGQTDLERSVPNFQQSPGEGLLTDLVTYGAPGAGAAKLVKLGSRAIGIGKTARAGLAARAGVYGAQTAAVAFSDAVMSSAGDEGIFIKPGLLQEYLGVTDEQTASDWAMFLDGMVFSGAIDSIMPVFGYGKNFAERRVSGVRAVFDKKFLENSVFEETMLSLVTVLDPAIKEVSPAEGRRRLMAMAEMFSSNAVMDVTLGDLTRQIPRDSATAVLNGAKGYISDTRQSLKNSMSAVEWAEYVDKEAANMALSMLSVTRAMGANKEVIQSSNNMAGTISEFIRDAGSQGIPEGVNRGEFFADNINALLEQRAGRVDVAQAGLDMSNKLGNAARDSLASVTKDNPIIADIMAEYPEGVGFKRGDLASSAADVMSGPLREQFNETWANVKKLYESIPNDTIGTDAASAFKNTVEDATRNINTIDASGDKTKRILGRIYGAVRPQRSTDTAGELVVESTEDLMERLGALGYQDLYRVKRTLSDMISNEVNGEVRGNLEAISRHITSSKKGGQMSFLVASGNPATVQAAKDADAAFIDARTSFEATEPMRRYSDLAREARRGDSTMIPENAQQRGIGDLRASSLSEILPTIVGDVTGEYMGNLMYAMRNLSPEDAQPFVKYYEAQAKFELAAALRAGDSAGVDRVFDVASRYRQQLDTVGSNLSDELNEVGSAIRSREAELGSVVAAADMSMDASKAQLIAAQDSILTIFINPRTDDLVGNPSAVIRDILFDKQGGDRMRELLSEVDRLPEGQRPLALAALRERASDILVDELMGSTPINLKGDAAQYNTMMGRLNTVLNGNNSDTLGTMQALYKDDPVYFDSFTTVLGGLMEANVTQRLKLTQAGSDTVINNTLQKDIKDSTSTGLLLLFGYMNPTAAAARRLTAQQVSAAENLADLVGKETLIVAVSNPTEFANMIRAVKNTSDPSIQKQIAQHFGQIFSHGMGYQIRVTQDGEDPLLDRGIQTVSEIERQTKEAFPE